MVSRLFIITLFLFITQVFPWCLIGRLNLTIDVKRVDISDNNYFIAATSAAANQVSVFETLTFKSVYNYTPTTSVAHVARFSRDLGYLLVGKWDGYFDVLIITSQFPFAATFSNTYDVQGDLTAAI